MYRARQAGRERCLLECMNHDDLVKQHAFVSFVHALVHVLVHDLVIVLVLV